MLTTLYSRPTPKPASQKVLNPYCQMKWSIEDALAVAVVGGKEAASKRVYQAHVKGDVLN